MKLICASIWYFWWEWFIVVEKREAVEAKPEEIRAIRPDSDEIWRNLEEFGGIRRNLEEFGGIPRNTEEFSRMRLKGF